jgi:1-acyl-sn-glycerol-3-phosphate acyltransferase
VGRRLRLLLVQAPVAAVVTAVLCVCAILAPLFDPGGRATREIGGVWSRFLLGLVRVRVEVEGASHVPAGPAVLAANHSSALDILVVYGYLPVDFRIIYKRSVSLLPLLGWAVWLGRNIPIDRGNAFRARRSLDAAAARIRGGTSVVVFPEGTRSKDGSVGRFKRGSFSLALEAGAPVVPVSLIGVKAVVPRGLGSVRPGRVIVCLHAPVPVTGRRPDEAEALAEEVRRVVARGCGQPEG